MVAFFAGLGLGLMYFGGLWWTTQRLPHTRAPALLALASFWGRLAACGVGFYAVTAGDWKRLLLCLAGFVLARHVLVRRWGTPSGISTATQGGPSCTSVLTK